MLKHSQISLIFASLLGVATAGLTLTKPVYASVVCEPGTSSNHSNGSLASCILGADTTIQVASASGQSVFPCKAGRYISFDSKGQFRSCTIYEAIRIREGNNIRECPADYRVSLQVDRKGRQNISCYR